MTTRLVATLVMGGLVFAPTCRADAHRYPRGTRHRQLADSEPYAEAAQRATAYWGTAPCGGRYTIVNETPPPLPTESLPGAQYSMWATWETPDGPQDESAAPTTYTDCVIHVNSLMWSTRLTDDANFESFCEATAHEFGHFFGYGDAGAMPGTVEYEYANEQGAIVPPCRRYRLLYHVPPHEWLVFRDEPPAHGSGPLVLT